MQKLSAPFIGTARHRLFTDGDDIATLLAFHGCPLRCCYTSRGDEHVLSNLHYLASLERQMEYQIRLSLIRGFNSHDDVIKNRDVLTDLGFNKIEIFKYILGNKL